MTKRRTDEVECPRCGGGMSVLDWRRCGPSCRLDSPPERTCGLCGGSGSVDAETAETYGEDGDGRDYEEDREEAAREAAWEAREELRLEREWE